MTKEGLKLLTLLLLTIFCVVASWVNIEEQSDQISALKTRIEALESNTAVDTLYIQGPVTFDTFTEFTSPVVFDSTVVFRDSVFFGNGAVSFVKPPLAAYD